MASFRNIEESLSKYLPSDELSEVKRIVYGRPNDWEIELNSETVSLSEKSNFEVRGFSFRAQKEELRPPRVVRIAAVQHSIVLPTTDNLSDQRVAIFAKITEIVKAAAASDVNIICFQEAWPMPFALCTLEKYPWLEFAENAETGASSIFLRKLARTYNMVIVSPILERDGTEENIFWNTAVVISNDGRYLGKHRKYHVPQVDAFDESMYYTEGNLGHPVFDTTFGKIAINICYGRHHPQNWMMFGINGAEIVFNPSATTCGASEAMWDVEARNAAIANSYFTVAINRVGTEHYAKEFTTPDGKDARKDFGPFYGSSYVSAPDGCRTPVRVLSTAIQKHFYFSQRIHSLIESFTRSGRSVDCGNGFEFVPAGERPLGIPNDAAAMGEISLQHPNMTLHHK